MRIVEYHVGGREMPLDFIGNLIDTGVGFLQADKERKRQKEFAQNSIQWRTKDALKAGIHPLAAMGMPLHSASPIMVGTDFGQMGQNIDNGIRRQRGASNAMETLALEKVGLENKLLGAQIRNMETDTASKVKQFENAPVADIAHTQTYDGMQAVVPSIEAHNRTEDQMLYELQHLARNQLAPYFRRGGARDAQGRNGLINPFTGVFHPFKEGSFLQKVYMPEKRYKRENTGYYRWSR